MNVIFDISVLGWSIRDEKAKTGIFRVIENLLFQFYVDKNIRLYLSAIDGNYTDVLEYLKRNGLEIDSDRFLCPKRQSIKLESIFQRINGIEFNLDKEDNTSAEKLKLFVFRIFRSVVEFILNLNSYSKSIPKQFRTKDFIFHSPYLPIPDYLVKSPIKTCISIYDLIPVLYPEYFLGSSNHLVQKMVKRLSHKTKIITISNHSRNDILKVVPASEQRTYVAYLAASEIFVTRSFDSKFNTVLSKYSLHNKKYIVSVSTIEPRKNLEVVINSFLDLDFSDDSFQLILVGTAGWGPSIEEIKKRYGEKFTRKIRFLGFVPDSDLAYIYSGALFFVYMSLYEGFGLPPLEAMQCGLPVISSNSSSLPEVVGKAGILIDPKDTVELKAKMLQLISDSELRESMSSSSLRQAAKFTWEKTAECVKEIYKQISMEI